MPCAYEREEGADPGSVLLTPWFFLFSWWTANETLAFRRRFECFGRLRAARRREEGGRRKEGGKLVGHVHDDIVRHDDIV